MNLNLKLYNINIASTLAFLTLILLEIIFAFSCRNLKKRVLNKNLFSNNYLTRNILLLIIIQIVVFVTPIKNIFGIVDIPFSQFVLSIIIVLVVFVIDELSKKLIARLFND